MTERITAAEYKAMMAKPRKAKKQPTGSKEKWEIETMLRLMNLTYKAEYKFMESRKFRFDFAIPDHMIAIEYEGIFSDKSRHTSVTGYSKDTEKYNLAAIHGWRVLRYTAMTYTRLSDELNELLIKKTQ
jgi:very-short-patch-repair endonuclease